MFQRLRKQVTIHAPLMLFLVVPIVGAIMLAHKAHSTPPTAAVAIAAANQAPGLTTPISNSLTSFTVSCATNPDGGTTAVAPAAYTPYDTVYCENTGTRPVFYGGASTVSEANGNSICNSATCLRASFSENVKNGLLGCDIADGGTVTIRCQAGK